VKSRTRFVLRVSPCVRSQSVPCMGGLPPQRWKRIVLFMAHLVDAPPRRQGRGWRSDPTERSQRRAFLITVAWHGSIFLLYPGGQCPDRRISTYPCRGGNASIRRDNALYVCFSEIYQGISRSVVGRSFPENPMASDA
jgi:hypothetical protein